MVASFHWPLDLPLYLLLNICHDNSLNSFIQLHSTLDEEKNGYVARVQLL